MTVKRVSVRGIELEFEEHGAGDRALVLVHGFTGSRRDFAPRMPALAALGPTVAVDLRGHGGSARTGDADSYTLDQLAEIAVPTLVLVGEENSGFLPAADELARGIAGARRIDVPRAAHQPQLENPAAWLDAIAGHLERVRTGAWGSVGRGTSGALNER